MIDTKVYQTDAFDPPSPCTVTIMGQYRDLQIAQLSCAAGQDNPVTERLRLFASVDVRFDGGSGAFLTSRTRSPFESASSLAASAAGGVSVLLVPEPGTLATGLAAVLVLAGLRAGRRSSRRSASSGAIRRAQSVRQGFPSYS